MTESPHGEATRTGPDKMMLLFAAVLPLLSVLDVLILSHINLEALGVRVLWAVELAACAFWMTRLSGWSRRLFILGNSAIGSVFYLVIVACTGGVDSPYVYLVMCLPLLVALVYAEEAGAAIVSGVVCMLGIGALVVLTGHPPARAITWASLVAMTSFFGVTGSSQFRRALEARNEARLERTRREAAEKLARTLAAQALSERLATVGRLAASVMHEINNPLAFVQANLRFLQEELHAQPLAPGARAELEQVLAETRSGVERVQRIVLDLKGFSRRDAEESTTCALADVVADAVRLAAVRLKHIAHVKVEMPPELPPVLATPRRLVQVLLNLLVNAGDAIEESGRVSGEILVRGEVRGERVVLLVEDNGPGFPPEVLSRLFESFFTTKGPEKGTGLGLVISRELLEHCGATLTAENREEGGARLRLEWPAHGQASRDGAVSG
ncbi:sensor histidine kinase [Cystobacter ferrugineus]|uniref:histidine kinase n=1 Tax=Cystobacter ferrugineus TaxID=83449 RepID=A0A1L9B4U4_9BACT|nr:ATP-binding protein [Cystobacter ferrugineus]OJH37272.1 two-component sensor histidine kinase [Cystobacter ferrugineus]